MARFFNEIPDFFKTTLLATISFFLGSALILHATRDTFNMSVIISDAEFMLLFFFIVPKFVISKLFNQSASDLKAALNLGVTFAIVLGFIFLKGDFFIALQNAINFIHHPFR